MKLLEQTTLVLVEGRIEKLYSIDLCEVGDGQYVVNFRYGVRGIPLKDGSKTVAPVALADARRIFQALVQQQTDKGYWPEGAARPAAPAAATTPTTSFASPAQRDAILARLVAAATGRDVARSERRWSIERVIWRAGELKIHEAEPSLLSLVGKAPLRDYCIAWALGRLGTAASLPLLRRLYDDAKAMPHVRRVATLSLLALSDDAGRAALVSHLVTALPPALRAPAAGNDPEAFRAALAKHLAEQGAQGFGAVEIAYVIDNAAVRPAVIEQLRVAPLEAPYFFFLRHIFKAAETKRDGLVFGIMSYRFETTRAGGYGAKAYGRATRRYLRDRVWRTLRRAGEAGDLDYVKLAVGVLLAYSDDDAQEREAPYPPFAPYIPYNQILYRNSPRYEASPSRKVFRLKARRLDVAPPEREEAFPKLWERRPEGLMHLLAESACTPVVDFAAKAIRAVPSFLDQLDVDDVIMLLGRPYPQTSRLALELAERLYRATSSLELVMALVRSALEPARAQGLRWLDEQRPALLANGQWLAEIVISPHIDVRDFARRVLRATAIAPAAASVLVARIVAMMLALGTGGDAQARDATRTLVDTLGAFLTTIGPQVILDLLAHPLAGVQELGAELIARATPGEIEDATLVRILQSEHENVRAVGLRVLAGLPDAKLAQLVMLLVRLSTDRNADLRNGSRPILARLNVGYPSEAETIARGLVEALLRRKLPEGAPSHILAILKAELFDRAAALPADDVWRLLQSGSAHAQELGGLLLVRFDPAQFPLEQIAALASHDILTVRQASWSFYERSEARVRASMAEASRILDAKWEDSRAFAFGFFRDRLGAESYDADVLVTILDSVREDVQAFGRELTQRYFREEDGPTLMTKLSEHPSRSVQLFTTNYLARYATNDPTKLLTMMPYFTSVLSRVNQGRIAKQRVLAFLEHEGSVSEEAARLVLGLLHRLSATVAVEYRGAAIAAMVAIHHAQLGVPLPLRIKEPPMRGRDGIPVLV